VDEYFVGRTAELAVLDSLLRSAVSGSTQFAVIAGPAWIGKTTLIRQFLDTRMPRTRWASGDEDETMLPGGLLEQFGLAAAENGAAENGAAENGAKTLRAGPALLAMMREWVMPARPVGAVLVIDDAQWGDRESLSALSYALRRLRDEPLLVVLLMCDDGYAHLPPGLVRVINDRGAPIELSGFDAGDIGELAQRAGVGPLPARAARRLREDTDGVPLYVREVLQAVPRESLRAALSAPEVTLPIPKSLEARVLSGLAGCSAQGQRLVAAAAVLGTACRIGDAAVLADLADPLPALQEATRAGLLTEKATIDGRCCEFPRTSVPSWAGGPRTIPAARCFWRVSARSCSGVRTCPRRPATSARPRPHSPHPGTRGRRRTRGTCWAPASSGYSPTTGWVPGTRPPPERSGS
jgi:hypothetical protein